MAVCFGMYMYIWLYACSEMIWHIYILFKIRSWRNEKGNGRRTPKEPGRDWKHEENMAGEIVRARNGK